MKVLVLDSNNVDEMMPMINKNECFIKFWMDGCGHCENMHHDWEELKQELSNKHNNANIAIVDVDSNAASQMDLGRSILGYPTIMHTRNGKEVSKYNGPRKTKQLKEWILRTANSIKTSNSKKTKRKKSRVKKGKKKKQTKKYKR
tara:strand:- start:7004 stop:7438 length:435 start_codon:yes stop_codon:yes gene_type:complete